MTTTTHVSKVGHPDKRADARSLGISYIDIWVPGIPVPQGDLSASRNGRLYHSNADNLKPWRYAIEWRAKAAMKAAKLPVVEQLPMSMSLFFVLRRVKGTAKTRATPPAIKKPDLDKLARACGDALTSVVYVDDSQIIESHCYKRIAEIDEAAGVRIVCTTDVSPYDAEGFGG